jgi:SpoVK/Ycf46/Vps4 family AAA+-type ATPase
MKLLKYIKFLESVLTVDELGRVKRGTDKSKGDVLVDKLGELNPVLTKTKDNSEVVITNAPDILSEITTDGKFDKINLKNTLEKGRYLAKFT